MKKQKLMAYYIIGIITSVILIGLDQLTKYLAVEFLQGTDGIDIIPGVFRLQYLQNTGAAFGMMQGQQTYFIVMTTFVLIALLYVFGRIPMERRFLPLRSCLIFLLAGAVGNLIDRIRLNYVIDFLYFELIDFPIFNVADIYVTVTCAIFILLMMFVYKEDELDKIKIFPSKKASTEEN